MIDVYDPWCGETQTYQLPRGLLRWHSSYFAAALDPDSDWAKAEDGTIVRTLRLEESTKVFDIFVCWLWTGRLKDELSLGTVPTVYNTYLQDQALCGVWIIGDMRGIPVFCNAAIDMLHEKVSAAWTSLHVIARTAYDNTTSGATLRKFLVDACMLISSYADFERNFQDGYFTTEFLLDAVPNIVAGRFERANLDRAAWTKINRCQWHDHSGPGGKLRDDLKK